MPVELNVKGKTSNRTPVSVKGVKDGLLFLLDEHCEHEELVAYLREMLFGNPSQLFSGPDVNISVDYGSRTMSPADMQSLLQIFLEKDNFSVREWGPNTEARRALFSNRKTAKKQTIHKGTVRNGQQLFYDGDVVVIGDVNPGAQIAATGDIYVFGKLAGIAHAGIHGDERAVIAAADFSPMQLRIAGTVSRAPEVNGRVLSTTMEFAYLGDEGMAVDKIAYLLTLRPERFAFR